MRDVDVRPLLLATLRDRHPEPDVLVVEELDLLGQVRVDVAVVNGAMWGYEIKSASDTLRRLPHQIELYSRVLDHASLVVSESHANEAIQLVPRWWEVMVMGANGEELVIDHIRPGASNPGVDAAAVVQLLWRDEAIALLTDRGFDRGVRSKPRRYAWERLVHRLELPELQAEVRRCLKMRTGWRGLASQE